MRVSRDPADIALASAQIGKPRRTVKPPPTDVLVAHCRLLRLPVPVLEFRFHPVRRWRFDLAFPDAKLAVEIDGGVFMQGRHARGAGIEADCRKYLAAAELGWTVLRVTPRLVQSGEALDTIQKIILTRI